jgi:hypothetical protein
VGVRLKRRLRRDSNAFDRSSIQEEYSNTLNDLLDRVAALEKRRSSAVAGADEVHHNKAAIAGETQTTNASDDPDSLRRSTVAIQWLLPTVEATAELLVVDRVSDVVIDAPATRPPEPTSLPAIPPPEPTLPSEIPPEPLSDRRTNSNPLDVNAEVPSSPAPPPLPAEPPEAATSIARQLPDSRVDGGSISPRSHDGDATRASRPPILRVRVRARGGSNITARTTTTTTSTTKTTTTTPPPTTPITAPTVTINETVSSAVDEGGLPTPPMLIPLDVRNSLTELDDLPALPQNE